MATDNCMHERMAVWCLATAMKGDLCIYAVCGKRSAHAHKKTLWRRTGNATGTGFALFVSSIFLVLLIIIIFSVVLFCAFSCFGPCERLIIRCFPCRICVLPSSMDGLLFSLLVFLVPRIMAMNYDIDMVDSFVIELFWTGLIVCICSEGEQNNRKMMG